MEDKHSEIAKNSAPDDEPQVMIASERKLKYQGARAPILAMMALETKLCGKPVSGGAHLS